MSDFTFAISEKAFNTVLDAIKRSGVELPVFSTGRSNIDSGGVLSYSCNFGLKLTDGKIDFRADGGNGNILIDELDITWDPLTVNFFLNIPTITIGCECVTIDLFFGDVTICFPCITLFESPTDITVPINLNHIFTHEFSGEFAMRTEDFRFNARTSAGLSDFEATLTNDTTDEVRDDIRDRFRARLPSFVPTPYIQSLAQSIVDALGLKTNLADKTRFYFEGDRWLDIDIIDFATTVANILTRIKDALVDEFLGFVPSWARDAISDLLGFVIDAIETILDFPDDVEEFFNDFFNVSFGMLDIAIEMLLSYVTQVPLYQIEKPYKIINPESDKLPLLIPYDDFNVTFTDDELILEVNTNIL